MINCKDRFLPALHKGLLEYSSYQSSSDSTAEVGHSIEENISTDNLFIRLADRFSSVSFMPVKL